MPVSKFFALGFLLFGAVFLAPGRAGTAATPPADPPRSGIRDLWVISHDGMTPAEQVLAQSLQGLTGRTHPRIWLRAKGMSRVIEGQLRREKVRFHEVSSVWDLLPPFKRQVKGMILYRLGTTSLNVATSLCGILNAVAIDESLQAKAKAKGLKLLVDARGASGDAALGKYRDQFAHGIIVEQSVDKPGNLRDFAIAHNAFAYFTANDGIRTEVARAFGPNPIVFGWGNDEYKWVADLSRANGTGAAADWCVNLSAMEKLPAGKLRRPRRPRVKTENGVRYVAFVMSDGDNLQWLTGNFAFNPHFYGSALRGKFPMTWEVSPLLSKFGPRVLQYLYATAKPSDGFVTGAGVPGYAYLHEQPDPVSLAQDARPYLRDSDLSVVSVLNENAGDMKETIPILDLPETEGVIYKDYAPYNRRKGAIFWHRGKPCVSYRFLLWQGLMGPEELARAVGEMPADPRHNEASYALVNVHAWSYGKEGGPMKAIQTAVGLLPKNARVVTADQMIRMLRDNFGAKHKSD
jgi:hypothetical protein